MAFVVSEKHGNRAAPSALQEGQVGLGNAGELRVNAADLAVVGIADRVVVLHDAALRRIALRTPDGDAERAIVAVRVLPREVRQAGKKVKLDSGRRLISVRHAVRDCGLKCKAVAGRYELVTKDNLLILTLVERGAGAGAEGASKAVRTANKSALVRVPKPTLAENRSARAERQVGTAFEGVHDDERED